MVKIDRMRKPTGMVPWEINEALHKKGLNQAAIARAIGVTPGHVSFVINGWTVSRRVHMAIAEAIGMDVKQIWPDLYLGGGPKRGRKRIDWNRAAT